MIAQSLQMGRLAVMHKKNKHQANCWPEPSPGRQVIPVFDRTSMHGAKGRKVKTI